MYEVEKIVSSRLNKNTGKNQYFVKWVGYDSSQNTWEPEKNLSTVRNLIAKFNMSNGNNGKLGNKNSTEKSASDEEDEDKKSLGSFGQESNKTQRPSENSIKKPQQKKSKPRNSSLEQKQAKKLIVTGISAPKEGGYIYKVLMDGEVKWVKRTYLVPHFLNELCEYYERNLVLKQ